MEDESDAGKYVEVTFNDADKSTTGGILMEVSATSVVLDDGGASVRLIPWTSILYMDIPKDLGHDD